MMRWIYKDDQTLKTEDSLIEYLLKQRGISKDTHEYFLQPQLDHIHGYELFHGINRAVERITKAIREEEQIFIHGDFDVDGVCATSLIWDVLYRHAGAKVMPYIPNRFTEGYGLTEESINAMREQGADLVITVDCGIRDQELITDNSDIDFIITDHHTIPTVHRDGEEVANPPSSALAVIHPQHPEGKYPFTEICGANVAWKLAWAVADKLDLDIDMHNYLDLVALATVCDVMPLIDENRVIVKYGLEKLKETSNPGLEALMQVADLDLSELAAYHFGYVIGPRINAAGRVDTAMDALKLLTTKDVGSAGKLALHLNNLNKQRQQLTQTLLEQAEQQIAQLPSENKMFVVTGKEWPQGILGLVAGKLTEKYHRPVIVLSQIDEDTVTGSARSTSAFHVAHALDKVSELLTRHGGHAQAAGLSLLKKNLGQVTNRLVEMASESIDESDLQPILKIDGVVQVPHLNLDNWQDLQALSPFGMGNAKPVWAVQDVELVESRFVGKQKNHLKLAIKDRQGNYISGIAFNAKDSLPSVKEGDRVNIAGKLDANTWNGQTSPQLIVADLQLDN